MASPGQKDILTTTLWQVLMAILNVLVAVVKGVGENVCVMKKDYNICSHSLSNSSSSWLHPRIKAKKAKRDTARRLLPLP